MNSLMCMGEADAEVEIEVEPMGQHNCHSLSALGVQSCSESYWDTLVHSGKLVVLLHEMEEEV